MAQACSIGRVTSDLELKTNVKKVPYLRFSVAERVGYGASAHTQYIRVWAWGSISILTGVVISNSETGLGAVCIQPLVFRLVCSNGMVVNEARTRRNHVGRVNSTDENIAIYSRETLVADDHAFALKIQDTVRAAVKEAQFSQVLDKMRESKQAKPNTADIPTVVKLASSNFGITETEGQGVLQRLIEDADYTLYGLANAVTRYSQDVDSYDRASKLEEIGYTVMTMSPELFCRINQFTQMAA